MQTPSPLALTLALLATAFGQAHAADDGSPAAENAAGSTTIEADKLEVLLDRKLRAIGDAAITRDGKTLSGDRIHYDLLNDELHVLGRAKLEEGGNVITGPELRIALKEREGEMKAPAFIMKKAFQPLKPLGMLSAGDIATRDTEALAANLQEGYQPVASSVPVGQSVWTEGSARGDAERLVFDGPHKERLFGARYTTCEVGRDDWFLRAGELELNHRAQTGTARNASIEFKGVPILYTPWIDFPLENQRKSGFLAPSFGTTTRSGVEFALPYYWNIAPDMDATLTPRYMGKRGMQMQGEFRYLDADYHGDVNLEYLPNDKSADRDRYFARLFHQHNFGGGWSGGYSIERVSDDQYFSDMSTSIQVTSRVNLPQQGHIQYAGDSWNFTGLVQKYQTLDDLSFPYERLPQLTLSGTHSWNYLDANLYTQWSSFDRANGDVVTTTPTPGSVLSTAVTGSRFVAYPSLALPLERPGGFLTPRLGLHYTRYSLDDPEFTLAGNVNQIGEYRSDTRTLPIFSVDSGLYFERNTRIVKNRYTQTLEPRLFYVYIPHRDQSLLPVFDSAEADLNMSTLFTENLFTGHDRINDANQLSLALTTRLIDQKTGIQRLAATIGQRFYFSDRKVGLPGDEVRTSNSSDIIATASARLLTHWNIDAGWQYNTDLERSIKTNLGARYNPEPGKVLNLGYRYTRERLEQIDISTQWPLGPNWYGLARWNYSLADNSPIEGLAGVEYDAGCWQARAVAQRVSTATADANYAFFVQLELGGLASIGNSPLSLLERSIPNYTSSALIPNMAQP